VAVCGCAEPAAGNPDVAVVSPPVAWMVSVARFPALSNVHECQYGAGPLSACADLAAPQLPADGVQASVRRWA